MRYHLNISVAVGGAAPVNPRPRPPAGGRFSFGGLAVAPRAPFLVFFIVWPAPALLFAQFFARFSSTFGVFLSTFGVFLSTYSLVFPCISRIFFVSLQYSYKVGIMFDSDLYQDDFLEAMDALLEGVSGSLFRVSAGSVLDRQVP